MIEREPITVILSKRGWIRAMKGHVELAKAEALKFKEGDGARFFFHAHTTDKLLLAAADGRFYTLAADKLPGGRGFGEPVKLMVDIEGEGNVVALFRRRRGREAAARLVGRARLRHLGGGRASPRPARASRSSTCGPARGSRSCGRSAPSDDYVAVIGENRKMVVYPLAELPEMGRGQGVQLQRYRDGGLADATSFRFAEGLCWPMGGESGRTRTESRHRPLAHRPRRRRPDAAQGLPEGRAVPRRSSEPSEVRSLTASGYLALAQRPDRRGGGRSALLRRGLRRKAGFRPFALDRLQGPSDDRARRRVPWRSGRRRRPASRGRCQPPSAAVAPGSPSPSRMRSTASSAPIR